MFISYPKSTEIPPKIGSRSIYFTHSPLHPQRCLFGSAVPSAAGKGRQLPSPFFPAGFPAAARTAPPPAELSRSAAAGLLARSPNSLSSRNGHPTNGSTQIVCWLRVFLGCSSTPARLLRAGPQVHIRDLQSLRTFTDGHHQSTWVVLCLPARQRERRQRRDRIPTEAAGRPARRVCARGHAHRSPGLPARIRYEDR